MMLRTDLNCDTGEGFGAWSMGADAEIMPHVTSANIACGFHAGDPSVMQRTVAAALEHGVAIGAHPGFPDLAGFGRRRMELSPGEVYDLVVYQVGALMGVAASQGARVRHVKPHGALYNIAVRDAALADAIARAVHDVDATLLLYGLAGSALLDAARAAGLRAVAEAFPDRGYAADGSLLPRTHAGAVVHDPGEAAARAVELARQGAGTLCIHGDAPGAAEIARAVRAALEDAGIRVVAP